MSAWIPLSSPHLSACQSSRSRIHAVTAAESRVTRPGGWRRTVCGLDARLIAHQSASVRDMTIIATWPPPITDRCTDCAQATGVGNCQQKGSHHWQNLTTTEKTQGDPT